MTGKARLRVPALFSAITILSLFLLAGKPANETELPKAPDGYTWVRFSQIQSAFLCPTGWHKFDKAASSSHTFVLSKESVKENGSFKTGLTVQAIKGLTEKKGVAPSACAQEMAKGILASKENTKLAGQDLSGGPFQAFFIRYKNAPAGDSPIVVHQVFIANDNKDTLFIITFEAPEESWADAWQLGEPMMRNFLIDDEY